MHAAIYLVSPYEVPYVEGIRNYRMHVGLSIFGDDLAFFDHVNLYIQVLQRNRISEVAIQAVGLFHQYVAAFTVVFQESNHFFEILPARRLGGLDINKLLYDGERVAGG